MVFILFLISIELISSFFYYQRSGRYPLAAIHTFYYLQERLLNLRVALEMKKIDKTISRVQRKNIDLELYSKSGERLLSQFKNEYEDKFKLLVRECNSIKSKLIILYIPSAFSDTERSRGIESDRKFYSYLTNKYGVEFIDMTDEFMKYPIKQITLLPENAHLSRYGNQILVNFIKKRLEIENYKSDFRYTVHPRIMGDLRPNEARIWDIVKSMPYRVFTNKQGFRNTFEIYFPKKKQRILVLGDSFTFGPYLPNHDTYTDILNKELNNKEFINAGIAGYIVADEVSLFLERAKYAEPDITILQVTDNDLTDFFYFRRNEFNRKRNKYSPTKLEQEFIDIVKKKNNKL